MTYQIKEIKAGNEMAARYELFAQLNPSVPKNDYVRMLKDMCSQGYRMIGIFDKDVCMGISGFWIGTKLYCGKYLEPDNVVIDKDHRSKGVGKILMDWLEEEAKRNDCSMVMLDAYLENIPGHRFYYREGYVARGFHFIKKI